MGLVDLSAMLHRTKNGKNNQIEFGYEFHSKSITRVYFDIGKLYTTLVRLVVGFLHR